MVENVNIRDVLRYDPNRASYHSSNRNIRLRERAPNVDVKISPSAENELTEFETEPAFRFRTDNESYIVPSKVHDDPDSVIAFVGGSAVECRFVEEKERFPYKSARIIEEETGLKINSYNAGVGASNSLHSLNAILNKVLTLDPDCIVFSHNWNDLNILLFEDDYRNDNPHRRSVQPQETEKDSLAQLLQRLDQLGKVVVPEVTGRMAYLYTQITGDSEDDDFARHRGKDFVFDEDELLAKFRANLMLFISICKTHQIEPVLMTQQNRLIEHPDPIIEDRFDWFYSAQKVDYTTYRGLYSTFNEEIRTVARENDVTCIDLDEDVPAISEYMYDPIHFKTPGSQYASRVIADEMGDVFQ